MTHTYDYGYDTAGRLVDGQAERRRAVATYSYDANGNRLSTTTRRRPTGTYDDQDRLLTYDGATYTYTANGELQTKTVGGQTTTYDYDVLGNLRR